MTSSAVADVSSAPLALETDREALVEAARARPHVVIIGSGFAGLNAMRGLGNSEVDVTLIDRCNYHLFQPLLYQVATAALEPADISGPLRQLGSARNVSILLGEVGAIDVDRRRVDLLDRPIPYDYLILATGSTHSYFGHQDWAEHAPGLKTLEDALEIRRRILYAFEAAERETEPQRQQAWLTFVIIGGGPTGVELAGAIAEISHQTKAREFKHIDPNCARVILLEGLPRVLTQYPEGLSRKAQRQLEHLGVEVRTGTMVTDVSRGEVKAKDLVLEAQTVIWAAGVAASPIARELGVELDRAGRVKVTPQLTVPGHPEIYVIGDLAALEQDGRLIPGLAPAAIAEGKHAAANVLRAIRGEPLQPFRYNDRGSFAVIGRGAAVGIAYRWCVAGALAWLAWLAIHITFLIGFRNRIAVLFNWAYVYFTRRRHAQLILSPPLSSDGSARKELSPGKPAAINESAGPDS
ncbi:MAG TPA: NAD(P)/FAD-dependent oxidoreductase [Polyangiaceae bacterium]|nr:NAD(P)/FAD-dependent oxidoreductase [Polyangiaceae bacterium]